MPGAVIVINQPTGAGAGTPGVARNDLWQNQMVELQIGTGGNANPVWTLLDKPPGSSTSIDNPNSATCHFTPDLVGTYRIQLTVNGGGPGNVQVKVARVRHDSAGDIIQRGWAYPAKGEVQGENDYAGNTRGWAEPIEFIFEDIRQALDGAGGTTFGGDLSSFDATHQLVKGFDGIPLDSASPGDDEVWAYDATAQMYLLKPRSSGGGGGGGGGAILWKTGIATNSTSYETWNEVISAANAISGPVVIEVDDTYGIPTIPSGTWNLGGHIELRGILRDTGKASMVFASNAAVQDAHVLRDLQITVMGSTPAFVSSVSMGIQLEFYNVELSPNTTTPGMILCTDGYTNRIRLDVNSILYAYNNQHAVRMLAAQTLVVEIVHGSFGSWALNCPSGVDASFRVHPAGEVGEQLAGNGAPYAIYYDKPTAQSYALIAGTRDTTDSGWTTIGVWDVKMGDLPDKAYLTRTVTFYGALGSSAPGVACEIRLVNAATDVTLDDTQMSSGAAGEVGPESVYMGIYEGDQDYNLDLGQALYKIQIRRVGGSSADRAICYSARVAVTWS